VGLAGLAPSWEQAAGLVAWLVAGSAVAWVDTPLMVLTRFKQQFPEQSYLAHARGIYATRGALGFYAAGHGLHSWSRPCCRRAEDLRRLGRESAALRTSARGGHRAGAGRSYGGQSRGCIW
jgi:hypothetical protein